MNNNTQPYRLGLDVGANSLGWFVVWLNGGGDPASLGPGVYGFIQMAAIHSQRPRMPSGGAWREVPGGGATDI